MTRGHVLVVGGGIGGLSAAIALRQAAYGVTVVELHSDVHSSVYGVGIIQPANALRALDVIGCAQACIDAGQGPAPRSVEKMTVDIRDNLTFTLKRGGAGETFRYCAASMLPPGLRKW